MKTRHVLLYALIACLAHACKESAKPDLNARIVEKFNHNWKFSPGDIHMAHMPDFDDSDWDCLYLPHDWSINEPYHIDNPGRHGTSFMIGGIGWYRKSFEIPEFNSDKRVEITFDGVYQNSTVWINGHELGTRPFGYISFKYDLTPYIYSGINSIAVRVDNSAQPNSRWYTGSGIYRNVWLTVTDKIYVDPWGLFITTPRLDQNSATVNVEAVVNNSHDAKREITLITEIFSPAGKKVSAVRSELTIAGLDNAVVNHEIIVDRPLLWSVESPALYTLKLSLSDVNGVVDDYKTSFGIRNFHFDPEQGFFLNGQPTKIKGVCMHHDLGSLGAAVNVSAIQRQLEILRDMGCNAIRTAHNPPAPELLQLCDSMGFLVMNETFDAWSLHKTDYDYPLFWDEWHERDLADHILRDRNHPSVIIWSIGNEILEQWHPIGKEMTAALVDLVKGLDPTRPVTAGNNYTSPENSIIASGKLDIIGYNYQHEEYVRFPEIYPGQAFIATETTSALATRGSYDMPSDSIRRWPLRWDLTFLDGNADNSCSSYDNCHAPWGSTHADTWKVVNKHDFLSGMFIWTGFDYLGEPTPYEWPSRSSYFGVVDLAGFPKDAYYMYQSEWTDNTVLHVFPHWNWEEGQEIDVWAYYSHADEVELHLNERSLGAKSKQGDDLHVCWRVKYEPGTLKAVSRKDGQPVLAREIHTAGEPYAMNVVADRQIINHGNEDLSFVTVEIHDEAGNIVPYASNLINITVDGNATLVGVDNGNQTSHEPFSADHVHAFHGKCIAIIRSGKSPGSATIGFTSEGLPDTTLDIDIR